MSRALDAEIAEKVMGYLMYHHEDDFVTNRYWMLMQSNGMPVNDSKAYRAAEWESEEAAWEDCPFFSSDIAAAWLVVQMLRSDGWVMTLSVNAYITEPWDCRFFLEEEKRVIAHGATAEIAICRAALAVWQDAQARLARMEARDDQA